MELGLQVAMDVSPLGAFTIRRPHSTRSTFVGVWVLSICKLANGRPRLARGALRSLPKPVVVSDDQHRIHCRRVALRTESVCPETVRTELERVRITSTPLAAPEKEMKSLGSTHIADGPVHHDRYAAPRGAQP